MNRVNNEEATQTDGRGRVCVQTDDYVDCDGLPLVSNSST